MTVQLSSPESLLQPAPYHHVAVSTGTRHVQVAGQTAHLADGTAAAPGDLAGQVTHALRNLREGLVSAGADFEDVVRLTFYVIAWEPEKMEQFMAGVHAASEEIGLPLPMPPASLIGVESLFAPDVLVEVEASAVLE